MPEGVSREQVALLYIVAFALLFENYDMSLLGLNLHFLEAEFGLDETQSGLFTGSVRLGALPAFFLVPLADRIGRRRLFLASIAGLSLGAFLSAFAQTATQFVCCQVICRSFIISASATAFVIIAEELPAEHRGWGIGMLGALASLGFGLGALLHPLIHGIGLDWRTLYALGIVPIALLPYFRRHIHETQRFIDQVASRIGEPSSRQLLLGTFSPVAQLFRQYPRRAVGIVLLGLLATAGHSVPFQYAGKFLQGMKGWTPGEFSQMFVAFGALGIMVSPIMGSLSDRIGRKLLGLFVLAIFPIFAFHFYNGPDETIPYYWVGMVFLSTTSSIVVRALANEVFPTASRATAGGMLSLVETLGAGMGLYLFAFVNSLLGDFGLSIAAISIFCLLVTPALALFPATARRELESISPEK